MRITALKASSRKPGFLTVEVDGARFALLPVEVVRKLRLEVDRELDDAQGEALRSAAETEHAYQAAVRLLAARSRSVQEMIQRLRRKGLRPDAVDRAVGRLESAGVLDDAEFARAFARSRADRGYGRGRILADLSSKGVERRVAERAADEVLDESEEARLARIERLARKRAGQLEGLAPEAKFRRLVGYLARRGYGGAEVFQVIRGITASADSADPGS